MTKKKTLCALTIFAGIFGAATAQAQTPSPRSPGEIFLSVSGAGQMQERSFANSGTVTAFNETGRFETDQNIGKGALLDVTGGYQFGQHLAFSAGLWYAQSKSAVAATASLPDPLFFGRFVTVNPAAPTDLKQNVVAFNIDIVYTLPLTDRADIAFSAGPTIAHVSQDVASVAVSPSAQTATINVEKQSKTSAKGGNVGADISYRFTEKVGGGIFVRYAVDEVDLPAAPKLKVGGLQVGAGIRYRF